MAPGTLLLMNLSGTLVARHCKVSAPPVSPGLGEADAALSMRQ